MKTSRRAFIGGAVTAALGPSARAATALRSADRFVPGFTEGPLAATGLGRRMWISEHERLEKLRLEDILEPYVRRPGAQAWAGEHVGKWLHAACLAWRRSRSASLRRKIDETTRGLIGSQLPDGYLGTYLDKDRWTDWDVWSHKYNILGLLAVHETTGDAGALAAARRVGDLLVATFGTEGQGLDIVAKRHSTHVGMASTSVLEPMVLLHRATGDARYLAFCRGLLSAWERPHGPKILRSLLEHGSVRRTANAKAYEMLSNVVGLAELHRTTGEAPLRKACVAAWKDVHERRSYPIGTSSWGEHFRDDGQLRPDGEYHGTKFEGPGEACVTVTWLQLTWQLLRITGDVQYAEEIERIAHNALCGAQSPRTGQVAYFVPLVGRKRYGEVDHGITPDISCCASSVPRGLALLSLMTAGTIGGDPAVILYEPGRTTLAAPGGPVTLEVRTSYPEDGRVEIAVTPSRPGRFTVRLRVPAWTKRFRATVGNDSREGRPGTFLAWERRWSPGDRISVDIDLTMRVSAYGPTAPGKVVVERGPQVLALDESLRAATKLPGGWIGRQFHRLEVQQGGARRTLSFVPFADAGQSRAEYTVLVDDLTLLG